MTGLQPTGTSSTVKRPDVVLIGSGVGDGLQLTVDSQRLLSHVGLAYGLGVQPRLAAHLRSSGVQLVSLDHRLVEAAAEASYLEIARFVLEQAQLDPPAVLIVPGNPLLSNAICRYIVMRAREMGLRVQILASVSPIDAAVNATGLDVGSFGLQVFDARRVVSRGQKVDASVPLLLLQLGALPADHEPLVSHLRQFYPADHVVTHMADGTVPATPATTSVPLQRFGELGPHIGAGSTLFVDRIRPAGTPVAIKQ